MRGAIVLAAALLVPTPTRAEPGACTMSSADRAWTETAVSAWRHYRVGKLHLAAHDAPTVVLFDAQCSYTAQVGGAHVRWRGAPHGEEIELPFGRSLPARTVAATVSDDRTGGFFFVMSLPSVWHTAGEASSPADDTFLVGVFLHEFMHIAQLPLLAADFRSAAALAKPAFEPDDDALQHHWETAAVYRAAFSHERDLLFEAANEPDEAAARELARQALAAMEARQQRFFAGDEAYWKNYDDIFLTMEGVGQWLNYEWQRDPRGSNLESLAAQARTRGDGVYWSQDEGLGLFLVIDRFRPGWAAEAFAARPKLGIELLREAVSG